MKSQHFYTFSRLVLRSSCLTKELYDLPGCHCIVEFFAINSNEIIRPVILFDYHESSTVEFKFDQVI